MYVTRRNTYIHREIHTHREMSIHTDTCTHKEAGPVSCWGTVGPSPAPGHKMFETNRSSEGTQRQKCSNIGHQESQRRSQAPPLAFSLCLQWFLMACPPEGLELGLLSLTDCIEFPHKAGRLGLRWKGHLPAVSRSLWFPFLCLGDWRSRDIKMRVKRSSVQSSFSSQEWLFSFPGGPGHRCLYWCSFTQADSCGLSGHLKTPGSIWATHQMTEKQNRGPQSGQAQRVASGTKMAMLGKASWS